MLEITPGKSKYRVDLIKDSSIEYGHDLHKTMNDAEVEVKHCLDGHKAGAYKFVTCRVVVIRVSIVKEITPDF